MFRAAPRTRSLHSVSALYRAPARASLSRLIRPNEPVREHTVRFRPNRITPLRLATFFLYSSCLTAYVWYFFPEVEVEIEEGPADHDSQPVLEDGFADDDSYFIPLTWAQKLPRTYYKGSDPEWQEFVKIAKDKGRHKRINTELVDIVYNGSLQHPLISKQLGRDLKVGNYWLDISFPDGPPQEYARSGIEIGDDFIALSTQRISPEEQHRIKRTLWPTDALSGLYNSSKVIFVFQYHRLKQMLGWEGTPEPGSTEAKYLHMLKHLQAHQAKHEAAKSDTNSAPAAVDAEKPQSIAASLFPWATKVPQPPTSVEMPIAHHVFNATLAKGRIPKKMEPPRGTFVVQGLVQVKGSRAVLTFDVQAFYDPKVSRFVVINASPRLLKKWNQAPKGGH